MGCSIHLRARAGKLSYSDVMLVASENVIGYYSRVFHPKSLEIWQEAPSKAMGGILYKETKISGTEQCEQLLGKYFKEIPSVVRDKSIFRIRGYWEMVSRKQQGYISLNFDPTWRQTYGNISMSLYPTADLQDLVDLFWSTSATRSTSVDSFIRAIGRWNEERKLFEQVYFAKGVPSPSNMNSFAAVHYSVPTRLYDDLILTIEATYGDRAIANISPYKLVPLLRVLSKLEVASYRLREIVEHYDISLNYGHSVSLVAQEPDKFTKAVKVISESLVLPAVRKLEGMPSIVSMMETGIKESPIQWFT